MGWEALLPRKPEVSDEAAGQEGKGQVRGAWGTVARMAGGERSGPHHSVSSLWAGAWLEDAEGRAEGRSRQGPQRGRCFCEVACGQCLWVRGRSCAKGTAGQTQLSSILFLLGSPGAGKGAVSSMSLALGERLDCHLLGPTALQRCSRGSS